MANITLEAESKLQVKFRIPQLLFFVTQDEKKKRYLHFDSPQPLLIFLFTSCLEAKEENVPSVLEVAEPPAWTGGALCNKGRFRFTHLLRI